MKRVFLSSLLITSLFINIFSVQANAWTREGNGWIDGTNGWSYLVNGIYSEGWKCIDDKWYYFYTDTNFMAHDTIVDGYYIDSNGAWSEDIPYGISKIMEEDLNYLTSSTIGEHWSFYIENNKNFKDICMDNWNVPSEVGTVYWIESEYNIMGYFVTDYGDVYCLGNQGGLDIYKIEKGQIVKRIPYEKCTSYKWRM